MKPRHMDSVSLLSMLGLLLACGSEFGEIPSAPLVSVQESDGPPQYSEWSVPVNLGPIVNSSFTDSDPSISKDGLSLYFGAGAQRSGGSTGRDIWVSRRASVDVPWEPPQNIGAVINTASHEDRPTLSRDGHRLYFASNRPGGYGDFDLYVSRRRDKRDDFGWEPPVNLGSVINSTGSEQTSVTFFEDEETGVITVYFASNRPGGVQNWDIYSSIQLPDGAFGPPARVEELSGSFRDRDPEIRRDGLEMFLASDRPGTYGNLDLWVATRASTTDPWSTPVNLGPSINSPPRDPAVEQANDWRPALSFDGTSLYFASAFRPGNVGFMFDIWVATRSKLHHDDDDDDDDTDDDDDDTDDDDDDDDDDEESRERRGG
jgi:hypothetical protein